ncbi:MAG: hypothetical protein FWD49_01900 [Firmicutes bacterium]|nr:hypothetical protein [Bacillota bacterium]
MKKASVRNKKISLIVSGVLTVIVLLMATVFSVAWFTQNVQVGIQPTTLISAVAIGFDAEWYLLNPDADSFNGQHGNMPPGNADAPYTVDILIRLKIQNPEDSLRLRMGYDYLRVGRADHHGEVSYYETDNDPHDNFTWRLITDFMQFCRTCNREKVPSCDTTQFCSVRNGPASDIACFEYDCITCDKSLGEFGSPAYSDCFRAGHTIKANLNFGHNHTDHEVETIITPDHKLHYLSDNDGTAFRYCRYYYMQGSTKTYVTSAQMQALKVAEDLAWEQYERDIQRWLEVGGTRPTPPPDRREFFKDIFSFQEVEANPSIVYDKDYYRPAEGWQAGTEVKEIEVEVILRLIYISEEGYRKWVSGIYGFQPVFKYSHASYMGTHFNIVLAGEVYKP